MFLHLPVILSTGGYLLQRMLGYPLGRHSPRQTPHRQTPSSWQTPWQTPPRACLDTHPPPCPVHAGIHTPLPSACWDTRGYCCGRYASYWNAFLYYTIIISVYKVKINIFHVYGHEIAKFSQAPGIACQFEFDLCDTGK